MTQWHGSRVPSAKHAFLPLQSRQVVPLVHHESAASADRGVQARHRDAEEAVDMAGAACCWFQCKNCLAVWETMDQGSVSDCNCT